MHFICWHTFTFMHLYKGDTLTYMNIYDILTYINIYALIRWPYIHIHCTLAYVNMLHLYINTHEYLCVNVYQPILPCMYINAFIVRSYISIMHLLILPSYVRARGHKQRV